MTEISEFPIKFLPHRKNEDGSNDYRLSEDDEAYEWGYSSKPNGRIRVSKAVFMQISNPDRVIFRHCLTFRKDSNTPPDSQ